MLLIQRHFGKQYIKSKLASLSFWLKNYVIRKTFYNFYWVFFVNVAPRLGCLCNKLVSSFLPHLLFNWRTFSRRVASHYWHQWAKIQVWTNQNSRNNWYQIVTWTIWLGVIHITRIRLSYVKRVFWHQLSKNYPSIVATKTQREKIYKPNFRLNEIT